MYNEFMNISYLNIEKYCIESIDISGESLIVVMFMFIFVELVSS